MTTPRWTVVAVALAAACSAPEGPSPETPRPDGPPVVAGIPPRSGELERERHERLAQRLARAMRNPGFRASVYREVASSPRPEGKVHLQSWMSRSGGTERRRLASLAGESDSSVAADLDQAKAIEVYLPVVSHRQQWRGDMNILVATAERDGDAPVAFDLMGRRFALSPDQPPSTPALMVSPAETRFDAAEPLSCVFNCGGGGGGAGSGGPGLYLTQTKFTGTFESWFKGDPEFEVHILGPTAPGAATMATYQCAGEHAGGAYAFDQNETTWSGSVLLFSQSQLDAYRATHGNQGFRIFVVEDDDTACEIKIDSTRTTALFDALSLVYGTVTGAKDSTLSFTQRIVKKAPTILRILRAVTSWFKTNDDPVGNAIEDPVAAGYFFPGANWVVKGENTVVNGALKLEMR
jgi:hypothetical protein